MVRVKLSVTSSQYADAPDRFKVAMTTGGTWTVSQSTTSPDGFSNSYKFDCTTADASPNYLVVFPGLRRARFTAHPKRKVNRTKINSVFLCSV